MDKTPGQRRRYVQNVVRGEDLSPTIPLDLGDPSAADADTDAALKQAEREPAGIRQPSRSRRPVKRPGWWEENKDKAVQWGLGILATLVTAGLVGYASYTLMTLNREVGQLDKTVHETIRRLEQMQKDSERTDDRFRDDLRRLADRLEDVRDRVLGGSSSKKK